MTGTFEIVAEVSPGELFTKNDPARWPDRASITPTRFTIGKRSLTLAGESTWIVPTNIAFDAFFRETGTRPEAARSRATRARGEIFAGRPAQRRCVAVERGCDPPRQPGSRP